MLKRFPSLLILLLCFAALSGGAVPKKPVALHPQNNRYFIFRGQPTILITSAEHYGAVLNLDFDYITYLNELQAHQLNYTRIFTGSYVEWPGAFNIAENTLAPQDQRVLVPWARSAEPGYTHGGNKFDLTRWDKAWFARLKDFVRQAGKRGIVVEVTLFSSIYSDKAWRSSPLHPANNINHTSPVPYKAVNTPANGNIMAFQEALVRQIVQQLRSFDNVIYEIQNEPYIDNGEKISGEDAPAELAARKRVVTISSPASLAWQQRIAAVIQSQEAGQKHPHLIAQNISNYWYQVKELLPGVSVANFHYSLPRTVSDNYHLNKPICFDESGFAGSEDQTYREQAWQFILEGGAMYNNLDYSFTTDREDGTDVQKAPGGGSRALRSQYRVLKEFIYGFDFLQMRAARHLVQVPPGMQAAVLANPGKAYAIYLSKSVPGAIQVQLPAGHYQASWVNVLDGKTGHTEAFSTPGGSQELIPPAFAYDVALKIIRQE